MKSQFSTVAQGFDAYRKIIPRDAGATQVLETERAFYAGAYLTLMNLLHSIDEDTDEEKGAQAIERLKNECEAYVEQREGQGGVPPAAVHAHEQSGFNVRHDEVEHLLREIGRDIKSQMPAGYGFTLLIFNFGPGGATFYLSSAERETMIEAMREFIRRNTQ